MVRRDYSSFADFRVQIETPGHSDRAFLSRRFCGAAGRGNSDVLNPGALHAVRFNNATDLETSDCGSGKPEKARYFFFAVFFFAAFFLGAAFFLAAFFLATVTSS